MVSDSPQKLTAHDGGRGSHGEIHLCSVGRDRNRVDLIHKNSSAKSTSKEKTLVFCEPRYHHLFTPSSLVLNRHGDEKIFSMIECLNIREFITEP